MKKKKNIFFKTLEEMAGFTGHFRGRVLRESGQSGFLRRHAARAAMFGCPDERPAYGHLGTFLRLADGGSLMRNVGGNRDVGGLRQAHPGRGSLQSPQRAETSGSFKMDVFIIGITGNIGGLLAQKLVSKGDTVHGLVRRDEQRADLAAQGVNAVVGDLATMSVEALAAAFGNVDAIVFSAGSNGGKKEVTKAIDGDGVTKAIEAARRAGINRFALVSVLPESWRERNLGDEVEYYFAVKKKADIALSRSDLDWLILRPSLLVDDPGTGTVSLGPAEFHGQIARADVAETLAELLHEPRISQQILELNTGSTPIRDAVKANIRQR
ncbi:NAD(P)H-binding protein [Bacillus swezeyi]|uniref:NAD(P)H-binding protein n=1 Tax=Bacillus swezeyi TaxID=1925020 RepID=UPI003F8C0568